MVRLPKKIFWSQQKPLKCLQVCLKNAWFRCRKSEWKCLYLSVRISSGVTQMLVPNLVALLASRPQVKVQQVKTKT